MFFILSKILAFLITPLIWVAVLLLWAIMSRDEKKKRRLLILGFTVLMIFSNSFLFDEAARAWEVPAVEESGISPHEYGIVLGGMSSYDPTLGRAQFYRGADRLIQAVELYRKGIIRKIVFTGGSGSIVQPDMKEGNYVRTYLLYLGIPREDILIEPESRNTHENAVFTKKLLGDFPDECILITSGFHMRRSVGCFENEGFKVLPFSTDRYAGPRKFTFDHMVIPNVSAFHDWDNLIHEIVGWITYKLMGYS